MLKTKKAIQCLLASGLLAMTIATYANNKIAGEGFTSPNKSILVTAKNPVFTLKLKSNRTTGYSWFLVSHDHNLLIPKTQTYEAPSSQLAGAGGYELWTFKATPKALAVPQVLKIVMRYAKPWEANSGVETVFTVVTHRSKIPSSR